MKTGDNDRFQIAAADHAVFEVKTVRNDTDFLLDLPNRFACSAFPSEKSDVVCVELRIVSGNEFRQRCFAAAVRTANQGMFSRAHRPRQVFQDRFAVPGNRDILHFDQHGRRSIFSAVVFQPQNGGFVDCFAVIFGNGSRFVTAAGAAEGDRSAGKFQYAVDGSGNFTISFHKKKRTDITAALFPGSRRRFNEFGDCPTRIGVQSGKRIAKNQKCLIGKERFCQERPPNFSRRQIFQSAVG